MGVRFPPGAPEKNDASCAVFWSQQSEINFETQGSIPLSCIDIFRKNEYILLFFLDEIATSGRFLWVLQQDSQSTTRTRQVKTYIPNPIYSGVKEGA
jgi:hypothetical protein